MASGGSQTVATFTGTLLRRERAGSQRLIQLVFREAGKNWLCVSTDPKTAKLAVGQNYRIEGVFKYHGDRPFIHEPSIALVRSRKRALKVGLLAASGVLLLAGTVGAVELPKHHQTAAPATSQAAATSDAPVVTEPASQPVTPPAADQATTAPAPTAAATPSAPAPVKKKTTVGASVSSQKATVSTPPSTGASTAGASASSQTSAPATSPADTTTPDSSATSPDSSSPAVTDPGATDSTPSS